jgi:2-dehydropantoate 2-reductase
MRSVGILGAGSIGCYLGAHLIHSGIATVLIGRQRLQDEVAVHGLHATGGELGSIDLPADRVRVATDAAELASCGLILVTVKSADTAAAALAIAGLPIMHPQRIVVSFQNGVRNADDLRERLPGVQVLAGMVPWNVVWKPGASFHRGTAGELMIQRQGDTADRIKQLLDDAGLDTLLHRNLTGVLWGKLLLNLNNPINALSGLPLRDQLSQRGFRRILAAMMREALQVMQRAGVKPVKAARLPPWLIPWVLDLPDRIFLMVASSMLRIDPQARSSMWEDLQRGRATEIDYINGEIVRLAESMAGTAPRNRAMLELVHRIEHLPHPLPVSMSAQELAAALERRLD